MKIGIFAGTFDPIHIGHTTFAHSAITEAHLNKVIIVAEKEPYRKKPHASWDYRQAMIERATEDLENIDHNYQFAAELAHSHTMKDMLTTAENHYGKTNEYWFLVGSDIFDHIHKWSQIVSEAEYGGFVVALRDNHTAQWVRGKAFTFGLQRQQLIIVQNTHPHVSSSKIRSSSQLTLSVNHLSSAVQKYILNHNLYQ